MKKFLIAVLTVSSASIALAGEPYYLISHGIVDSSSIAIYGYLDNKTPCITLEKFINKTLEEERNYHRFSCVDSITAMVIDCKSENNNNPNCIKNLTVRNKLLKTLNIK